MFRLGHTEYPQSQRQRLHGYNGEANVCFHRALLATWLQSAWQGWVSRVLEQRGVHFPGTSCVRLWLSCATLLVNLSHVSIILCKSDYCQ
jgi:hypothetical protein